MRPSTLPRPRNARPEPQARAARRRSPGVVDLGRRLVAEVGEEPRERADAAVELDERRRVVRRTSRGCASTDLPRSPHSVTARPSGWGANTRTSGETSDRPWLVSAELAGDGRPQPADRVGERRDADAGRQLLGDGRAADPVAGLEDEHAEAAGCEVGGRGQAVVAGADDDRVVAGGRSPSSGHLPAAGLAGPRARRGGRWRPSGRRPGCVDEPDSHRSRIGRPEPRVARDRPVEEQLLERQLALEDVALGQPDGPLDVERRQDLAADDDVADVRARTRRSGRSPRRRTPRGCRPRCPRLGSSLYGAYWTKQLMTCLPGGAIWGSTRVGMIMSMYGLRLQWPYFASS